MAARRPFKNHMTRPNAVPYKNSIEEIKEEISDNEDQNISYEMFNDYMPRKLKLGKKHPDPVVESSTLTTVEPPDVWYQFSLPNETIANGALSALQLEAIAYASQAHNRILPNGSRAGFLIGDGAGVGKGRTIAGVIFENYLRGRKNAVWISVSADLKYDAERDLRDIGAKDIKVLELNKCKYVKIDLESGVVFSTYQTLIGETKTKAVYKSRLEQLVDWCGKDFDGPIVFDECHRAKNLCPVGSLAPPKTGLTVLQLQKKLPKARIVYASATGASEPRNMAYMDRLGLWGEGSLYPQFSDFYNVVDKRGVGAMELVAMEMKLRGMYIARQLSFQGVTFRTEDVPLDKDFIQIYNDSVKWWVAARRTFQEAAELIYVDTTLTNKMWQAFWGVHQRFFKYLCIAAKVPHTVTIAKQAIKDGKCVVIGLQSTGDAGTMEELEKGNGKLSDFVSITKGLLRSLTENKFPASDLGSVDDINALFENMNINNQENIPVNLSREERVKRAKQLKKELLDQLKSLEDRLPLNTLDRLADELGGPENVAEMSGRKGRVVRTTKTGVEYERRSKKDSSEAASISERRRFMDGEKLIAIISDAASTGISLQSSRLAKNQRRRVHVTLELPWSADKAVQQFGRTHRSNQECPPEYVFLITDIAGERRFVASVAKRLESLGALTQGDRRTADTRDLSKFNYSNKYGRRALDATMSAIMGSVRPLVPAPKDYNGEFFKDISDALVGVGLIIINRNRPSLDKDVNIEKFFNRLLGLTVNLQNILFEYFTETLQAVITSAKKSGEFDSGILNLGSGDELAKRVELYTYSLKSSTGVVTAQLHVVQANVRGLTWREAFEKSSTLSGPKDGFYLSHQIQNNKRNVILVAACDTEKTPENKDDKNLIKETLCMIYRPHIGLQSKKVKWTKIKDKYRKVAPEMAKISWNSQYVASERTCVHAYWKGNCKQIMLGFDCEVGVRKHTYYIVTGSVLSVWRRVEEVLATSRMNAKMQIVRLKISDEEKVIGTLVPKRCFYLLNKALTADAEKTTVDRERYQNLKV